jgi:hypothetical protein
VRNSETAAIVLRSIIAVFAGAVLTLGGIGIAVALGNGRPGIAIALVFVTTAVTLGSILVGRDVLAKYDAEAYDFRRYD